MLPWQCSKHTETDTNIQADIWMAEGRAAHTNTQTHTRVSAAKPRPSVTLSPYERQIVKAISGGPAERLQPCSGVMEEVAAHRQALLAASHTLLSPPLTHFLLSIWEVSISPLSFIHPQLDLCLHSQFQCSMHLWAPKLINHRFHTITEIPISILQQESLDQLLYENSIVFWKCITCTPWLSWGLRHQPRIKTRFDVARIIHFNLHFSHLFMSSLCCHQAITVSVAKILKCAYFTGSWSHLRGCYLIMLTYFWKNCLRLLMNYQNSWQLI